VLCNLTPEGTLLAERLQQAGTSHVSRLLEHLSADELRTVVAGLEVLCWAAWNDAAPTAADARQPDPEYAPAASGPVSAGPRPR